MTPRTVVTLVGDLKGSTLVTLEMSDGTFQRWNAFLVNYLRGYLKRFALDDTFPKFTGDGWLLTNPDLERTHALVALAKTISMCGPDALNESEPLPRSAPRRKARRSHDGEPAHDHSPSDSRSSSTTRWCRPPARARSGATARGAATAMPSDLAR